MKSIEWSEEKNELLISTRGVSFEQCRIAIERQEVLDIISNKDPYSHQNIYVLRLNGYIHYIPYVEDEHKIFLKTIIPNRKANKYYDKK